MGHLSIANLKSILTIFSLFGILSLPVYCYPSLARPPYKQIHLGLKLTSSQQRQIAEIKNRYRVSLEEREDAFKETEEQLRNFMSSSNASTDEIRAKHFELRGIAQEIEELRFNSMLEIRQVLNPAQRLQLSKLIEKHRQKFSQTIRQERKHEF